MFKFALDVQSGWGGHGEEDVIKHMSTCLGALGDHGPRLRISFASETRLKTPLRCPPKPGTEPTSLTCKNNQVRVLHSHPKFSSAAHPAEKRRPVAYHRLKRTRSNHAVSGCFPYDDSRDMTRLPLVSSIRKALTILF